jgi:endonuclease G
LSADDPGLESILESTLLSEGAEASENWYREPRLDEKHQTPLDQYAGQKVPGFPVTRDPNRIARMFQRGHLVRRMDPAWGSDDLALRADADTFHVTNCAPQVGFFNMGTARPLELPQTENGALWRAIENYVLRNAVDEKSRICCFTGPVFRDDDPEWRGIRVPLKYWKIVVWPSNRTLHSLALIADQKPVLDTLEGLP